MKLHDMQNDNFHITIYGKRTDEAFTSMIKDLEDLCKKERRSKSFMVQSILIDYFKNNNKAIGK